MLHTRWNGRKSPARWIGRGLLACLVLSWGTAARSADPSPEPPAAAEKPAEPAPSSESDEMPESPAENQEQPEDADAPAAAGTAEVPLQNPPAAAAKSEPGGSGPATPSSASSDAAVPRGLRFEDGTGGQAFRFIERAPKASSPAPRQAADADPGPSARQPAPPTPLTGTAQKSDKNSEPPSSPPAPRTPASAVAPGEDDATSDDPDQQRGGTDGEAAAIAADDERFATIHSASFQGIIPGTSTEQEVLETLGEPQARGKTAGATTLTYKLGPFPQVDVHVADGKVRAVVVHLSEATTYDDVVSELQLNDFRSCRISDPQGKVLGRSFPDRGIQLLLDTESTKGLVKHVVLELITAEPFVLRAAQDTSADVDLRLQDLRLARRLDPDNTEADWLAAQLHAELGEATAARAHLQEALAAKPRPEYRLLEARLLEARLLGREGRWKEAVEGTRQILTDPEAPPLVKARAECQLGDLLADGPEGDVKQAIEHHLAASRQAKELVAEGKEEATRQAAQVILVDAHLGAANDIARGQWSERSTAVTRWLEVAEKHAEKYDEQYGTDAFLQWRLLVATVTAHVGLQAEGAPAEAVERILELGERSLKQATGPRQRAFLREQLARTLFDAMRVAYARNDYVRTRQWAREALPYLQPETPSEQLRAEQRYRWGRALFLVGSCHAHDQADHQQAVIWYERAIAQLDRPLPAEYAGDLGRHGQRFVTMGVSYWHTGSQDESLKLTEKGARWMEQAVAQGRLEKKSLAIPYSNLASMHRSLGHGEKAAALTAQVQKLEGDSAQR